MTKPFWFGEDSMFNGVSTFLGYLMPKHTEQFNQLLGESGCSYPHKGISPNVNVIVWLECERLM